VSKQGDSTSTRSAQPLVHKGLARQTVSVLGATGSIGKSTLDVLARHPDEYRVYALSAHSKVDELFALCQRYEPEVAVVGGETAASRLHDLCQSADLPVRVAFGSAALDEIASHDEVDIVVAAIVGAAGLMSTLAAAKAGKRLLLANKESLVMSGDLLMTAAKESGALILPVDSEHNAIFQSLPATPEGVNTHGIVKILLTASGGPLLRGD